MYHKFSHYYDKIFQSTANQIDFIKKRTPEKGKVLDLAAGTGNQAISLYKIGYDVSAIEYDHNMYLLMKDKMKTFQLNVQMIEGDMRHIDTYFPPLSFNTIYCVGNSIVHLSSLKEIESVIEKAYSLIKPDGVFLIQNINYDRILEDRVTSLPAIINVDAPKEKIEFERNYEIVSHEKIIFRTGLKIYNGEFLTHEFDGAVPLYPLLSKELNHILEKIGFKQINLYGSYQEEPYHSKSYALVVEAIK